MNSKLEKNAMRLAQELHDKKRELSEVKKQLKAVQKYIAELESPKTCEGCDLEQLPKEWSPCAVCVRYCVDYYEPKTTE